MAEPKLVWTLQWDADWVTAVTLAGRRLFAGNNLGQLVAWDLPDKADAPAPNPVLRLDGHTNVISRLTTTPDGKYVLSSSYDHAIRIWDAASKGTGDAKLALNARTIDDLKRRRASKIPALLESTVKLQHPARSFTGHREWVSGMSLTKDGKTVLSADDGCQAILWDFDSAKETRRWSLKGWAYAVAISPDGKQALLSERKPLVFDSGRLAGVKIWDTTTGQPQHDLDAMFKGSFMSCAAFSPDGKVLALGKGGESDFGKVTLIDPATGKKSKELSPGHQYGATDLVFSPDGKHLASTGRDTTVKIWDVASGKMLHELSKPRGGQFKDWTHAVSYSADGKWLAAADMAGAVLVWSL
jgi:WD40 repeat protein